MNSKHRLLFWILIIIFFVRGIYLCFFIPPWEAPDETEHVSYVAYLYHNKAVPTMGKSLNISSNLNNSLIYQRKYLLPQIQKTKVTSHKDLFNRNAYKFDKSQVWGIAGSPPLYYLYLSPFYLLSLPFPSYISLVFLRIGSLLLGIGSLICMYQSAKLLFPKSTYIPIFILTMAVFHPMFTFISAVVNNDNIVIFFFLLFIYFTLRYLLLTEKLLFRNSIFVAIIAGIATVTKPQMIIVIPIFFLAFLFINRMTIKKYGVIFISTVFIPVAWYGGRIATEGIQTFIYPYLHAQKNTLPLWMYPIDFIKTKQAIGIFMSSWGFFGWLDVPMPKWAYLLFLSVLVVAGIGWVIALKNKKTIFFSLQLKKAYIFLYIATLMYTATIWFYDITTFTKAHTFIIQGRYLLPILFVVLVWIIQGLYMYKDRLRRISIIYALCIFISIQVIMYTTITKFYYHRYTIVSPFTKIYLLQKG